MVSKLCDRYFPSFFFFRVVVYISHCRFLEAGAGGGLVASIATCPLDVIKTKLQAQRAVQGQQAYLGVFGVFFAHPVFHSNLNVQFNFILFMIRYVQVYSQR